MDFSNKMMDANQDPQVNTMCNNCMAALRPGETCGCGCSDTKKIEWIVIRLVCNKCRRWHVRLSSIKRESCPYCDYVASYSDWLDVSLPLQKLFEK